MQTLNTTPYIYGRWNDSTAASHSITVTPGNGIAFQYRNSTGASSGNANTTGLAAPYWVKVVRVGETALARDLFAGQYAKVVAAKKYSGWRMRYWSTVSLYATSSTRLGAPLRPARPACCQMLASVGKYGFWTYYLNTGYVAVDNIARNLKFATGVGSVGHSVSSKGADYTWYKVTYPRIYSGASRTVTVSYDLPGGKPRSGSWTR